MDSAKTVKADFAEGSALCSGAPQFKHHNGLGQYYFDCTALGTYNLTQASQAATAWDADATQTIFHCVGDPDALVLVAQGATQNAAWQYAGTGVGHVRLAAGDLALCPSFTDPAWN